MDSMRRRAGDSRWYVQDAPAARRRRRYYRPVRSVRLFYFYLERHYRPVRSILPFLLKVRDSAILAVNSQYQSQNAVKKI